MINLQHRVDQVVTVLTETVRDYAPIAFANSLGAEDMVLTDIIDRHHIDIEMFSLDTGRLPQETYDLMQTVRERYKTTLRIYFPNVKQVEAYVAEHGVNGFYQSVDLRKNCCYIRKVEPLRRALQGKRGWVTGIRREQASTRANLSVSAYDMDNRMQKINPLLEWTHAEVWEYLKRYEVPYNKLHDKFYPSIGCAPCTRAITPGEDIRSGRWWWETPETKECGLHTEKVVQSK
ncbi:phosphoadenylyl-sulfate reductase [Nitrosomonas ureae]|uniref:Adenosine 5'-phosphosulfate reductase n=1 Tax=Nitrosomonas ureae TaxID=44577 RepID=A0A0S3AH41_9PROT|nr:phosphoadenylyl-sulfate reductase [Nitrosomonas ureae]ALQ50232.1 phosphoadenosine phosphosulfate reductase [Nitrosomonas ureae]PTQ88706.1 phosphoadenylylsulfate reductase (thioredoxin) [Nitrosomonas ureae]SDU15191.1 phosphoadenylylsulfate reductase (thioredoxin) [Nitrosomonas ureae]SEQ01444.1 phosphoadenosine phosphosulfate reductase [Nitrosomonas ureae]SOD17182.1 phosphoadenylylsulfate reductase (thioredoxin) [Nitrosomonas ureae]